MTRSEAEPSRGTILIVDDAMDMRVFLSALFRTHGYRTETCRDGSTGLAKAREIRPDLIVLDVMMPGSGGALMYKSLKTDGQLKRIPVIMLSAVGQHSFRHYLKMLNIKMVTPLPDPEEYLEKPPDARQLLDTATRLMALQKG
ncbi:response regulator [Desulfosarcina alkanivorans]|jgi:CheY-like chemotaxis protein|uniref:Response regulator n=1 Tax=Desulfosarcina alkanivorans TaxID=571177 RepID=A0A5K7YKJ6_9BACT|nr:response regulator [Desulfosarcina alkanivorans]BBO69348.1 response regulator [Desulfosarcina alkanivorans]